MIDTILQGDVREQLRKMPESFVNTCITSPPYFGLRDYGMDGQIGLEETPEQFVENLVDVFREVRRVLRDDGTLWVNLGDSYSGSGKGQTRDGSRDPKRGKIDGMKLKNSSKGFTGIKPKDLIGIPWRVAFALQADGWYLRQDIIWHKPNPMPESVTDRCTKAHEYVFLLSKNKDYYFDNEAIKEPAIYGGTEERIERARNDGRSMPTDMKNGIRPRDSRAGKGRIEYEGKRTQSNGNGDSHGNGQPGFVSISETRNKRSVWSVTTKPFAEAHFATFPEKLIEPMVLAGSHVGGVVLDPFMGAGTTAVVAKKNGRNYVGTELNPAYIEIAQRRIGGVTTPMFV